MTWLRQRRGTVANRPDDGSALVMALVFLMIFGSWVGVVLQFAATGQRTTVSVRAEATSTYSAGGALEGAINAARSDLSVGSLASGTTTCFTLPTGSLDNPTPVTVTCQPRSGSGSPLGGASTSQPADAVLALSTNTSEGVAVTTGSALPTQGSVLVNKLLTVPAGATLTSSAGIRAGTCPTTGTVNPSCTVAAAGTAVDPSWPGPAITPASTLVTSLPSCGTVVALSPGIYRSASALQTVLGCPSAVVWFRPGTYFFDFRDAGSHELSVGAGDVVVGGAASGWTPGTTAASAVPYPAAAAPTASACDTTAGGVDMVFGGDSGMSVTGGGRMQLCALATGSSSQHVVLRGLASAAFPSSQATAAAASSASSNAVGAWAWTTPAAGAVVDGATAYVRIPNTLKGPSKLTLAGLGSGIVPADATGVSVTATVTETVAGTGNTTLTLKPGSGATPAAQLLEDCLTSATCPATAFVPGRTDSTTFPGLTAGQVNGMSFDLTVNNPNASPVEAWVDGVSVVVTYSLPVAAVSGTATAQPYVSGSAATTPLLKASGAATVLALHGTVYAPTSAVDLAITSVPWTVVDRGMVVRHLLSSMTTAAGFTGPLVSVPSLGQAKRTVLLTASDPSGATLARADVTFASSSGLVNGTFPTVNEWTVN